MISILCTLIHFGNAYKHPKNQSSKEKIVKPQEGDKKLSLNEKTKKVVSILTNLLLIIMLVVIIVMIGEILWEHFFANNHLSFIKKVAKFIQSDVGATNLNGSSNKLEHYIGYLQLLIAIITLGIGGIALINFVTSREALREVREESKKGIEDVKSEMRLEIEKVHFKFDKAVKKLKNRIVTTYPDKNTNVPDIASAEVGIKDDY